MQKKNEPKVVWHEPATFLPNPDVPREKCVPDCRGCNKMYCDLPVGERMLEDFVCIAYINPKSWWDRGGCPLKSNKVFETDKSKKVNPLKYSKRIRRRGF